LGLRTRPRAWSGKRWWSSIRSPDTAKRRPLRLTRADSASPYLDIARMPLLSSIKTRMLCCSTLTLRPRMTRRLQSSDRSYRAFGQLSAPTPEANRHASRLRRPKLLSTHTSCLPLGLIWPASSTSCLISINLLADHLYRRPGVNLPDRRLTVSRLRVASPYAAGRSRLMSSTRGRRGDAGYSAMSSTTERPANSAQPMLESCPDSPSIRRSRTKCRTWLRLFAAGLFGHRMARFGGDGDRRDGWAGAGPNALRGDVR